MTDPRPQAIEAMARTMFSTLTSPQNRERRCHETAEVALQALEDAGAIVLWPTPASEVCDKPDPNVWGRDYDGDWALAAAAQHGDETVYVPLSKEGE